MMAKIIFENRKKIGSYVNGNYTTTIYDDGTRIRETEEDEFIPAFAENCDIKITDSCNMGCSFCHEGSTPQGKHGDILNPKFLKTFHPYQELACLDGETVCFGLDGAVKMKDLRVGDKIFDNEHKLRKIINIQKTEKESILLKGNKGLKIISSKDHPFFSNEVKKEAKDMAKEKIDFLKEDSNFYPKKELVVDFEKYMNIRNSNNRWSRGGQIKGNKIKLSSVSAYIDKKIKLNEELMYLYGLYVAEGSRDGLVFGSFNNFELERIEDVKRIWKENFGLEVREHKNKNNNSISVELQSAKIAESFFVKEMEAGKGARNKTIQKLFKINNKEFIRKALLGVFDGDGSYRVKKFERKITGKITTSYNLTFKTSSWKLAYEILYLLSRWFGIQASLYYGINQKRKIENRTLSESDYFQLEIYNYSDLLKLFPERFNKIKDMELQPSQEPKIKEIIPNERKVLYDITLENGTHIFPINGYILTHNCGGGNVFEHPDLIPFLENLKKQKVIANITVHQVHFMQNLELIKKMIEKKLIYGIGVSVSAPTDDLLSTLLEFPNAVCHVINGIWNERVAEMMGDRNLKVLILGYKELRRGNEYIASHNEIVVSNKKWLYNNLEKLLKRFKLISFDNLAIEQLCVKRLLSDEEWESFYQGDDGTSTFYIDAIEQKFAQSSTAPFEKRYDIGELGMDEMFKIITDEYRKEKKK